MRFPELAWKRIAIVGYWIEWRSTYAFLQAQWVDTSSVCILDHNKDVDVPEWADCLLGENCLDTNKRFDLIFLSPWLTLKKRKHTALYHNHSSEIVTSQIDFFLKHYDGIKIWVTWSKWKSTTATFLYQMLEYAWKSVALAWNIGTPALELFDGRELPEIVVLEVSSYMLESLQDSKFDYAIFTSLHEAHIWSHGSVEKYVAAKMKLLEFASQAFVSMQVIDSQILTSQWRELIDEMLQNNQIELYGSAWAYVWKDGVFIVDGVIVCDDSAFAPLWDHMRWNVCSSLWVAAHLGIDSTVFELTLKHFQSLEHRLEFVWTFKGIDRYNDSFATTTDSVAAAIQTLWDWLKTIFVWWYDNGASIDTLVQAIQSSALENIILFPDTWQRLRTALGENHYSYFETNKLSEWLAWAVNQTPQWASAVLSCGFPSFTMWNNYVERWLDFKQQVRSLDW